MKLYMQIRWHHSYSKQTFHHQLGISSVSATAQYGNHQSGSNIKLIAFIAQARAKNSMSSCRGQECLFELEYLTHIYSLLPAQVS